MLSIAFSNWFATCHFAYCRYAECRGTFLNPRVKLDYLDETGFTGSGQNIRPMEFVVEAVVVVVVEVLFPGTGRGRLVVRVV